MLLSARTPVVTAKLFSKFTNLNYTTWELENPDTLFNSKINSTELMNYFVH